MKVVRVFLLFLLILGFLSRFMVCAQSANTGVVGEVVAAESFDNGIIVFYTYEGSIGEDLNGDGDTSDDVIRYYDVFSEITTNTTVVGYEPAIGDNLIAFLTYESSVDEDLNNDTDKDDTVVRYYDILLGKTKNVGEVGYDAAVDDGIITFTVAEAWLSEDLNEDGDTNDRFVWYHNVSNGKTFNATTILGAYASKDGDIIAFETWESWDATDLNGDGDTDDTVIRYYNMSTGTVTNTGAAGNEPSMDGNIIVFYTDEYSVDEDLNGDGDKDDPIIRYYNISSSTITNTGAYGEFPSVEGNIIAFETYESDFGEDLNSDGDIDDIVIRYYDISAGMTFSTAAVGFYASVDNRKIAFSTYESDLGEDMNGDGDTDDTIIRYYTVPQIYQGDLILKNNDVYVIEGMFNINGSIIVEENATLILHNAWVNFTQKSSDQFNMTFRNSVNGNPRLTVENANMTTSNYFLNAYFKDNSSATINRLLAPEYINIYYYSMSSADISNSELYSISCQQYSTLKMSNSTIHSIHMSDSAKANITNSDTSNLNTYSYSEVTISKCTINNVKEKFNAKCHIYDSTIIDGVAYNSSKAWLFNTTISNSYNASDNAVLYIGWYLNTHVIDLDDNDVPSANITITDSNGTEVAHGKTLSDGWASFTLLEKIINATGTYLFGNYTIKATYQGASNSESTQIKGNTEVTVQLPFIIPEFSTTTLLPLLIIITLFLTILARKRKSHQP